MTSEDIREARKALGLSAAAFAKALNLGANGGRTVRRWEAGDTVPNGPVAVAIRMLLEGAGHEAPTPPTVWSYDRAQRMLDDVRASLAADGFERDMLSYWTEFEARVARGMTGRDVKRPMASRIE